MLRRAARAVPVAEVVASDPYGQATGQPLLLHRYVEGTLLGEALAWVADGAEAAALGRTVGAALARSQFLAAHRSGSCATTPAITAVTTLRTAPASGGAPFRSAKSMCPVPITVGARVSTSVSAVMRPSSRSAVR